MEQVVIETKRLILRPFVSQDALQVQELAGDKRVSASTLNIPYPYENGMAESWIASHKRHWVDKTAVVYAVTLKNDANDERENSKLTLIGTMSLVDIQGHEAELGYWFGVDFWGQNYCTEAALALVEHAFLHLGINTLIAEHLADNPASGKVMQNVGMQYLHKIQKIDRYGRLGDIHVYQLRNSHGLATTENKVN